MICSAIYVIDRFHLFYDDGSWPILLCDGWFHCSVPVHSVTIAFAGGPALRVVELGLQSADVASLVGVQAGAARFRFEQRVDLTGTDPEQCRLVVAFGGTGDCASIDLGCRLAITRSAASADPVAASASSPEGWWRRLIPPRAAKVMEKA